VRLAIVGSTSEIAREFTLPFARRRDDTLTLFVRRPQVLAHWLQDSLGAQYVFTDVQTFGVKKDSYAEFNFFGVGYPAITAAMGVSICDISLQYPKMVLQADIKHHQNGH
jgi:hypothetical protein